MELSRAAKRVDRKMPAFQPLGLAYRAWHSMCQPEELARPGERRAYQPLGPAQRAEWPPQQAAASAYRAEAPAPGHENPADRPAGERAGKAGHAAQTRRPAPTSGRGLEDERGGLAVAGEEAARGALPPVEGDAEPRAARPWGGRTVPAPIRFLLQSERMTPPVREACRPPQLGVLAARRPPRLPRPCRPGVARGDGRARYPGVAACAWEAAPGRPARYQIPARPEADRPIPLRGCDRAAVARRAAAGRAVARRAAAYLPVLRGRLLRAAARYGC